ncbi:MAG: HEPN domain-containing protein [bacterium]
MPESALLQLAESYLRTARAALEAGDIAPAYETARTACELAAKAILDQRGIPTSGKEHNVAPQLVQAGAWPGGDPGKRLSKFLNDYTRGVYGVGETIARKEAERGVALAEQMIKKAKGHG